MVKPVRTTGTKNYLGCLEDATSETAGVVPRWPVLPFRSQPPSGYVFSPMFFHSSYCLSHLQGAHDTLPVVKKYISLLPLLFLSFLCVFVCLSVLSCISLSPIWIANREGRACRAYICEYEVHLWRCPDNSHAVALRRALRFLLVLPFQ